MREIKFRAWDKTHIGVGVLAPRMWYVSKEEDDFDFNKELRKPDVVLMQYTGLKDKKGVEIYEGDILESKVYGTADVKYIDSGFWLIDKKDGQHYFPHERKVIGNIYENPDLLERREK